MSSPSEEVYVVEQLVKDEMGYWWKPMFTHTKLAVALGKLEDLGPVYHGAREASRLRVYRGTATVITRAQAAGSHHQLLKDCQLVCEGKAGSNSTQMVAWVTDAYVAIGMDCLTNTYERTVERNRERLVKVDLEALEDLALTPLEVLDREFEYSPREVVLEAEAALLKLSDKWVPKGLYRNALPKVKKPVQPLTAVEVNRPCVDCGTTKVKDFAEPGDSRCVACQEEQDSIRKELNNEEGQP